ncbi:MAG TPA: hypothetical protein PKJ08_13860 [Candidatus Cloacimonadota bacterium]|jgi:hypothetical protein|nr:hypothetical protein [Candidatus Cloacimonadota bacterium]HPM00988.1 hypothetical protein [Candidatus Cloacimonadota bacterium]
MSYTKKSRLFFGVGMFLALQYQVLRLLGIVQLNQGWVWKNDMPAMLGVLGTILMFVGLFYHFKSKNK